MKKYLSLFVLLFTACVNNPSGKISEESSTVASSTNNSIDNTPSYSQDQLDSIEKVNKQEEIKQKKLMTIKASILLEDYRENEVRSSQAYEGKYYYIKGEVSRISTDVFGKPFICMAYDGVHLTLNNKDDAVNLSVGDGVTIYGKIGNYIIGTVMVDDCTLSK